MSFREKLLAAVLLALALLAQAPAGLVAAALNGACAETCALDTTQGTLWRGSARLLALEGGNAAAGAATLATLAWAWQPAQLTQGALAWRVDAGQGVATDLRIDLSGVQLAPWRLALPASAVDPLLRRRLPLREASGALWLESGPLHCAWSGRCAGAANLTWRGARLVQLAEAPLGSFRLQIEGEAGEWRYQLASLEGPLRVQGSGLAGAAFSFQGDARLEGEGLASLAQLLATLGPRDAAGNHRIDFRLGASPPKLGAGGTGPGS